MDGTLADLFSSSSSSRRLRSSIQTAAASFEGLVCKYVGTPDVMVG